MQSGYGCFVVGTSETCECNRDKILDLGWRRLRNVIEGK
jgi:hypothetical protein